MSLKGMDTEAVRGLVTQMNAAKDEIDQLQQKLTGQLHSVQWVGPDREQFLSDWQSQHVAALHQVSTALGEAATRANQNATEQDNVSQ